MEIILVRHTKTICTTNTCYGQSDVELALTAEKDLKNVVNKLNLPINMPVYSSPLSRCKLLAKAILNSSDFTCDSRLMELNFGDWELKSWDNIDRKSLDTWGNDFVNIKCPSGEAFKDLYTRCNEFVDELSKQKCKSVLIVTHSGVIRSILCKTLGMPIKNAFNINLDFGSVSKITINESISSVDFINR